MNIKLELLNELKLIKLNGPLVGFFGICGNVTYSDEIDVLLWDLFAKWPNFSGHTVTPVEESVEEYRANRGSRWDKNTKYGALRWELLDFLISELEK